MMTLPKPRSEHRLMAALGYPPDLFVVSSHVMDVIRRRCGFDRISGITCLS